MEEVEQRVSGCVFSLREGGEVVYRVSFRGRVCSPTWRERGPAALYLKSLRSGARQPEHSS